MSYLKAEDILPKELIETIQQYVNGTNIYIPSIDKKDWGSRTCSKEYYELRNRDIHSQYMDGMSVNELAQKYSLSEKTIYKILSKSHLMRFDKNENRNYQIRDKRLHTGYGI